MSKYKYNYDFFRYWSHDLAYFLGFFCADGYMSKDGYTISFELARKDIEILKWIQSKICPQKPLRYTEKYDKRTQKTHLAIRFRIHNKDIYNRLLTLGFISPKTGKEIIPTQIPKYLISSFIKGYFDGDGWVHIRRNQCDVGVCCANQKFLYTLRKYLNNIGTINNKSKQDIYLYSWDMCSGDSIKFRNYIYKHRGFCLKRKFNKLYTKFQPHSKFWTQKQEQYLINNYADKTYNEIAKDLSRTFKSVSIKASRLSITNG